MSQQNVMFIIIDQLRADALFGGLAKHVDLPNLRALMGDGVTFKRNYSVTNPCGPSRVSILTGQYAMNHRSVRNGTPLRHDTPNIATEVRKAGYMPLLFGYTDTAQDPRAYPKGDPALKTYEHPMHGFHEVTEMRLEESYPWRADLIAKGYDVPDSYDDYYIPVAQDGQPRRLNDPAFYRAEDSDTAFLTNACLTELGARTAENWFAHLTYIRPHPPLVAPTPYNTMYDPATLPLPLRNGTQADETAVHSFMAPAHASQNAAGFVDGFEGLKGTDDDIRIMRAVYLGLATEVDDHIGRVVDFLKTSGQYDSTLIVVTADHGEMLGDRYEWGKMSVYDAAYHTPLIIRDPHNPQAHGTEVTKLTESIDITPTILEWIGRDIPDSMDGAPLTEFLQGGTPNWPDHSFSELDFGNPVGSTKWQDMLGIGPSVANLNILRGPRYTLVHFNADLPPLLFDHEAEGELRNVAANPENAPIVLEMTRQILSHRMQNADQTLATTMITSDGPVRGRRS
ncbi:sulfatase-like hydrolase/transferase [Cochlodiniinecator piscidefendens]|uniref:sulfatase-like hydrolase/transferase n=1 Tax=Cochlodiniinecator piscidefendens TaxID=2715756 RepID=UPI00140B7A2B|nr:sulfatase-like hydrolase/transferase [Cochlodiniinecator piscidefendens]